MYPEDLKYTSDHEWVRTIGENVVQMGITQYAQEALGDIVYVSLPESAEQVAAGQVIGEVESTKSVSEIYAPVSGTVSARNDGLDTQPDLVNTDPYGDGWMVELRLADADALKSVLGSLMDASAYQALIEKE